MTIPGNSKLGVDISEHNGTVNFDSLKRNKVDFVIIRCGYGDNLTTQDDHKFWENLEKVKRSGLPFGVYLYSYAATTQQAEAEAAHVLRLIKGEKLPLGVWYDVEENAQYRRPRRKRPRAPC